MTKENSGEKDLKEPEMLFYDVRVNCEPCRRILEALEEICDDVIEYDESREKDIRARSEPHKHKEIRPDLYEKHIEQRLDESFQFKYPKEGIPYKLLREKVKMRKQTFLKHLRDHLLHHRILQQKKDRSYILGRNFQHRKTLRIVELVEFIKKVPASRVRLHEGVGYFNVSSLMDHKDLVKISQRLKNEFREMVGREKGRLVLPDVIVLVLDMKKVLRS